MPQDEQASTEVLVMFRIIGRRSWDELQSWHKSCPGSTVEHVMEGTGLFILTIPAGGVREGSV